MVVAFTAAGCGKADDPKAQPSGGPGEANAAAPAATALTSDAPVIASGPGDAGRPMPRAKGPEADNSRCHVCHLNFSEERLAVGHAVSNVSCEKCHGSSDDHCSDEGNVTAPTILFAKSDVVKACKECHPDDREGHENLTYCLHIVLNPAPGKVCTDCHGAHQMARRTVHWDPKTHKLLPKNGTAG
jgi:hypothetical protein